MNNVLKFSGSYAAGNYGNKGHLLKDLDKLKTAASCMDPRIPHSTAEYIRAHRIAGPGGLNPDRIYSIAEALVRNGCEVVETHDDCGLFKLIELEARKIDDPYTTLNELNPADVNYRAKKYGRKLADIMAELYDDSKNVTVVHLKKEELCENHGAERAYIFENAFNPYAYGLPEGFMIGGGFETEDILNSVEIALSIGKMPFEITYVGCNGTYDNNIINELAEIISNHEFAEEINISFRQIDGNGNYFAAPAALPIQAYEPTEIIQRMADECVSENIPEMRFNRE